MICGISMRGKTEYQNYRGCAGLYAARCCVKSSLMHSTHVCCVQLTLHCSVRSRHCCDWPGFFLLMLSVQKCRFGKLGIWDLIWFGPKRFEMCGWDGVCIQDLGFDTDIWFEILPVTVIVN